jgi:hypothetical protein
MMKSTLISRYQTGGDIYNTLSSRYGAQVANSVAAAAATGDEIAVNGAIPGISTGRVLTPDLNDSTWDIFGSQLVNDPLAAPVGGAENVLQNTLLTFLKNPLVMLAVGGVLFLSFGGFGWLRKKFLP